MRIIASWAASSASRLRAGDPSADGVDPVVVPAQQRVERRAVAGLGGRDELASSERRWRHHGREA